MSYITASDNAVSLYRIAEPADDIVAATIALTSAAVLGDYRRGFNAE